MTDMEYEMFLIADEIAMEEHGEDVEFYDLPDTVQMEIYKRAEQDWMDKQMDKADNMRKEII